MVRNRMCLGKLVQMHLVTWFHLLLDTDQVVGFRSWRRPEAIRSCCWPGSPWPRPPLVDTTEQRLAIDSAHRSSNMDSRFQEAGLSDPLFFYYYYFFYNKVFGEGGGRGFQDWETHVHPWCIHVDVWQNQYIIVK